jgi:hypothetical protein
MINLCLTADCSHKEARKALAREWKREKKARKQKRKVLDSDDYLTEWADRHGLGLLGRASWYKREHYLLTSVYGFGMSEDPRRPVAALGSRACLFRRYSNSRYGQAPNGWCEEVMDRYRRRVRYTCFSAIDHHDCSLRLMSKLRDKYGVNWKPGQGGQYSVQEGLGSCWINGKSYWGLTSNQFNHLKKLWRISKKLERFDEPKIIKLPG